MLIRKVSVLFNEPKLLKSKVIERWNQRCSVSVLFNEPKLLKYNHRQRRLHFCGRFSALQRAEIAEMCGMSSPSVITRCFSALQRAEIAEILYRRFTAFRRLRFSALQRAEIAEITVDCTALHAVCVEFQCSSTSRNC